MWDDATHVRILNDQFVRRRIAPLANELGRGYSICSMASDPNLAWAAKNNPESLHRLILDPRRGTINKPGRRLSEHWSDDLRPSILNGALLAHRRLSGSYGRTEPNANFGGSATQQPKGPTHNASYPVIDIPGGWSDGSRLWTARCLRGSERGSSPTG